MITRTNPEGAYTPTGYHHVNEARGGRTLYIAGQVAYDRNRRLLGGDDVVAQTRAVLQNLGHRLAAVGARPEHVVKITTYVVHDHFTRISGISGEIVAFFGKKHLPGNTMVGVTRLAVNELLVEIEAIAVVND